MCVVEEEFEVREWEIWMLLCVVCCVLCVVCGGRVFCVRE
jgi:hypothetical protein